MSFLELAGFKIKHSFNNIKITMKKLTFIFVLFVTAITAAQINVTGSYSEKLTYLINAGTSNFDALYDGVIPTNRPFDHKNYIEIPSLMNATVAFLRSDSQDAPYLAFSSLSLLYNETDAYQKAVDKKQLNKIRENVTTYFDSLAKMPGYKVEKGYVRHTYTKNIYLFKNNQVIASYHDKQKGFRGDTGIGGSSDYEIDIYEQQRTTILANEGTKIVVYPAKFEKTTAPQIWERNDVIDGKNYFYHFNGIFTSAGILKVGTKTLHGFGPKYDGTWYSENWEYGNVKFTPEGTNDIVCGYFKGINVDIKDFYLRDNFAEKFKVVKIDYLKYKYTFNTDYSCDWVKNVYNPYSKTRQDAQDIKDAKRNAEVQTSNAQYAREHPAVNNNTSSNGVLTYCPICNGTGKVVEKVTTNTQFETTHYKTCPHCGGSGR